MFSNEFSKFYKMLVKNTIFEKKEPDPYTTIASLQLFGTKKYVNLGLFPAEKKIYDSFANRPGKALIIGCSAGRECVYLAEKGWKVLGIDYIEDLLRIGRHYAEEKNLDIEYRLLNIEAVEEASFGEQKFDFIAFTIFPLVRPRRNRARILKALHKYLRDDGKMSLIYRINEPQMRISNPILIAMLKVLKRDYEEGDYIRGGNLLCHIFSEKELESEMMPHKFKCRMFSHDKNYSHALIEKVK